MSKHTPGPWSVGYQDDQCVYAGGKHVATVQCDVKQYQANARLIAAAPDGLAANKLAVQVIRECMRDLPTYTGERGPFIQALKVLDATIAKAEGGAS